MFGKTWLRIDIGMIPSKLCYFFQNVKSSTQVYMILFLTDVGLNKQEASLINGIQFLGFVFGGPCLGFLADRFKCHFKIAQLSLLISTIALIIGPVFAITISDVESNKCNYPSLQPIRESNVTMSFTNASTSANENQEKNLEGNKKLSLMIACLIMFTLSSMFGEPILGFVDAACVHRSNNEKQNQFYSHQRLFEPLGWQCGILMSSVFIKFFPTADVTCYTGVFVSCALYNILLMTSLYALMKNLRTNSDVVYGRVSASFSELWSTFKSLLLTPKHVMFFANVCAVGIIIGTHVSLIYTYLQEISESLSYVNGYTAICSTVSIFFYIIAPALYSCLKNHWIMFCVIAVSFAMKMLIFSLTTNLNLLLASGCLLGFQSFFFASSINYVQQEMPKELHSTIFNVVNVLLVSFGYVVANIAGGSIYGKYGPKTLFFSVFVLKISWSLILLLYIICTKVFIRFKDVQKDDVKEHSQKSIDRLEDFCNVVQNYNIKRN